MFLARSTVQTSSLYISLLSPWISVFRRGLRNRRLPGLCLTCAVKSISLGSGLAGVNDWRNNGWPRKLYGSWVHYNGVRVCLLCMCAFMLVCVRACVLLHTCIYPDARVEGHHSRAPQSHQLLQFPTDLVCGSLVLSPAQPGSDLIVV
jgi:hypothetical protein